MPPCKPKFLIDGIIHVECSKCNVVKAETEFSNIKKDTSAKHAGIYVPKEMRHQRD